MPVGQLPWHQVHPGGLGKPGETRSKTAWPVATKTCSCPPSPFPRERKVPPVPPALTAHIATFPRTYVRPVTRLLALTCSCRSWLWSMEDTWDRSHLLLEINFCSLTRKIRHRYVFTWCIVPPALKKSNACPWNALHVEDDTLLGGRKGMNHFSPEKQYWWSLRLQSCQKCCMRNAATAASIWNFILTSGSRNSPSYLSAASVKACREA